MMRARLPFLSAVFALAALSWSACADVYHVAPVGLASNAGTAEAPFATITQAVQAMSPGDACLIRAGTYRETVVVERHGEAGKPIRIAAAPGERVVIQGCDALEAQWSRHRGRVFKAEVKGDVRQVFVGDRMMIEARWPNLSLDDLWNRSRWARAGKGSRYGEMVDPELAKTGVNWTGAVATLNVAHQFYSWTRTVTRHSAGSKTFEYAKDLQGITHYADKTRPWEDDRYYLTGKLAALDTEGEWFHDADAGILYLWAPEGVDPSGAGVHVKRRDYGIVVRKASHVEVSGLHFFGCTFSLEEASHCVVDGCHVKYPNWARRLNDPEATASDSATTSVVGDDNTIRRSSFSWGPTKGLGLSGRRNVVDDCLLHDFCWDGSLRHPMIAINSHATEAADDRCVIRNCTLYNAGNAVINYRGLPGHIIERNHVYNGGLCCKDVALVYTGQPTAAGSVVRYNWVHGCYTEHKMRTKTGFVPGGLGIRGDDQTRSLTVHHNVVWDCGRDGIIVKGDHNRVVNNTVLTIGTPKCAGNYVNLHTAPEPKKPWRKQHPLLKVQNANSKIINNVALTITGDNRGSSFPFAKNMAGNFKGRDPQLVDPERFDFRPRAGSPLIDAGEECEGFTEGYQGEAPDIGAYESDGERWVPGVTWDVQTVLGATPRGYIPTR